MNPETPGRSPMYGKTAVYNLLSMSIQQVYIPLRFLMLVKPYNSSIPSRYADDTRKNFFYVPNVFSPNEDGINDIWQIMPPDDMEVLSFELWLFDRWGNPLKHFTTVYDSWDGSFKDKDLDPGVFVWWYQATVLSCGRTLEVFDKGDVTVVKCRN